MKEFIPLGIFFCIIFGTVVFTGVVKGVIKTFSVAAPAADAESSRQDVKDQSQRAADIQEKNRQLMERTRERMERMKH